MLDRMSKELLEHLNKADGHPSELCYDFDEDLNDIAAALSTDAETVRAAVRHLEKLEYLQYGCTSSGIIMNFQLDHKGLHWKEFYRMEIVEYIREKWIDFLAMLFALGALAVSICTACSSG